MKKKIILTLTVLCISAFFVLNASAQFPIKIPKIGKPKVEKPTAITDGSTFAEKRNPDSCFENTEVCRYTLWSFKWKNFRVESYDPVEHKLSSGYVRKEPNAIYTKDKPGEYTVKIFYKGTQVRETKFIVQPNAYASQMPLDRLKAVIPVKIMGTLDKYNQTAWKTDAFYGNPLTGFSAP